MYGDCDTAESGYAATAVLTSQHATNKAQANPKPDSTLVIIPTYNERADLPRLIAADLAVDPSIDILVVDDNSPDGTGDLAAAIASETHRLQVLRRASKLGLGTAYIAGFKHALTYGYTFAVEMDVDFSHRPQDLPRLLLAAREADMVIASRNVPDGRAENWSIARRALSKCGSMYAHLILKLPVKDCTAGFKCFRCSALATIDLDRVTSNGFGFQIEMDHLCRLAGLRLVEVSIIFPDRTAVRYKMSLRITLEALVLVWRLRLRASHILPTNTCDGAPYRTSTGVGLALPTDDHAIHDDLRERAEVPT